MHFYLFGDKPDSIFSEDATSIDDIEVVHYGLLLEYLSESDFVYEGHRRYFAKELVRYRDSQEKFREFLSRDPFESFKRAQEQRYASCTPGSSSRVRYARLLGRILNGTHIHDFSRTMSGDFYCQTCGVRVSGTHDLGDELELGFYSISIEVEKDRRRLRDRRVPRLAYLHNSCDRCGALPMPFWVSKGRSRLVAWSRVVVRSSKWCWAQVRKPVVLATLSAILSALLSAVLTNLDRVGIWWPF